MTKQPHIAGRDIDESNLVQFIKKQWEESLDLVEVYSYNVLLSYPRQNDPNFVSILNNEGSETDRSQIKELVLDPEQNDPNVVNPFNAYSAAGNPQVSVYCLAIFELHNFYAGDINVYVQN